VSSREDAEELTLDVFVKAYQKINSFRGESANSTWLYRIAYNTAISAIRRKKPIFLYLDEKTINEIPDEMVDEVLSRDHDEKLLQSLQQAIGKLDPEEKALISLYYTQ
jgi:RNA polymerase sigma-70 factor, ECF subfamily